MVSIQHNICISSPVLPHVACLPSLLHPHPQLTCSLFFSLLWPSVLLLITPLQGHPSYSTPGSASKQMSSSPCSSSDTPSQAVPWPGYPTHPVQALTPLTGCCAPHSPPQLSLDSTWATHSRALHGDAILTLLRR